MTGEAFTIMPSLSVHRANGVIRIPSFAAKTGPLGATITLGGSKGSAGGNDVASLAKRVMMILRHDKRKLLNAVAHLTSPGFVGGKSRKELGLRGGGPHRVITDKAVLGFDSVTHSATLLSLHPAIHLEDVVATTGFPLIIPKQIPLTPLPTPEELRLLREEIDPNHVYL